MRSLFFNLVTGPVIAFALRRTLRHVKVTQESQSCISDLWDRSQVLGKDGNNQCLIKKMDPLALDGAEPPNMCLRNYPDKVSTIFQADGFWRDCLILSNLWKELPDRSAEFQETSVDCLSEGEAKSKLFVDIGSNIGTCLMQMAARNDVPHTLAFEPSQTNLFYLTNSVLGSPGTAKKITLFPSALGSSTSEHDLYAEAGNAGNTVLDKPVHTDATPIGKVTTYALDDLLMKDNRPPYIHLLKIDAQGFEIEIMKGARKLLASGAINAVKFELAAKWLIGHNSSSAEYLNQWTSAGYQIYAASDKDHTYEKTPLTDAQLKQYGCAVKGTLDFVGIYQKGMTPRSPVTCH